MNERVPRVLASMVSGFTRFANPKSQTRARRPSPSYPMRMFWGLMSRWTMGGSSPWATASPRHTCRAISTIEFPHSPNERVKVDSVGRFYELLTETLKELAG